MTKENKIMKILTLPGSFSDLREMLLSKEYAHFKIHEQLDENPLNKTSIIERFIIREKLLKTFCEN